MNTVCSSSHLICALPVNTLTTSTKKDKVFLTETAFIPLPETQRNCVCFLFFLVDHEGRPSAQLLLVLSCSNHCFYLHWEFPHTILAVWFPEHNNCCNQNSCSSHNWNVEDGCNFKNFLPQTLVHNVTQLDDLELWAIKKRNMVWWGNLTIVPIFLFCFGGSQMRPLTHNVC